jgi:hypothetical protein
MTRLRKKQKPQRGFRRKAPACEIFHRVQSESFGARRIVQEAGVNTDGLQVSDSYLTGLTSTVDSSQLERI